MNHLIHVTWLAASTALASAAALGVGVWNVIFADVDPESVLLTAGGASSLIFIWFKVWTDSRAQDRAVTLLQDRIDYLEKAEAQNLARITELIAELHQTEIELAVLRGSA